MSSIRIQNLNVPFSDFREDSRLTKNRARDLSWITYDRLVELAVHRFGSTVKKMNSTEPTRTDPTSAIARSLLFSFDDEEIIKMDRATAVLKTLQNAVGMFHQDILGSVNGWNDMGTSGGVFDIQSVGPVAAANNREVIAEVKMRYNTIKASEEKNLWDKLKDAYRQRGGKDKCVAYLIQIIPKSDESYDRPWKLGNRPEDPNVRVADGTTAYHLVTGDPNALNDLIMLLPTVLADAFGQLDPSLESKFDFEKYTNLAFVKRVVNESLPEKSALSKAD